MNEFTDKDTGCYGGGHGPDGCFKTVFQYADLKLPIEVKPNALVGRIETECCGEPCVTCDCEKCKSVCYICITQKVRIKIPVKFELCAEKGEVTLECDKKHCCDK